MARGAPPAPQPTGAAVHRWPARSTAATSAPSSVSAKAAAVRRTVSDDERGVQSVARVPQGTVTSAAPGVAVTLIKPRSVGTMPETRVRGPSLGVTVKAAQPGSVTCTPRTPQETPTMADEPQPCEYVPECHDSRVLFG